MNQHEMTLSCRMLCAATVIALGALAGCGDDDDGATVAAADAETAPTSDASRLDPSPDDPYCDIERQIDAHFAQAFSSLGAAPSEEQMMQAAQAASAGVVDDGLIERATAIAPPALADDLALLADAVRSAAGGDVSGFMTPESDAAGARVDAYCGLED